MQGTRGNAAVAAYLQRQPKTGTPPGKTGTPPVATDTAGARGRARAGLERAARLLEDRDAGAAPRRQVHPLASRALRQGVGVVLQAALRRPARRRREGEVGRSDQGHPRRHRHRAGRRARSTTRRSCWARCSTRRSGETAELGVGSQIDTSTGVDFAPPDATADKEARKHLDTLFQGAMGVAGLQAAALAYSPRRDQIREGGDKQAVDDQGRVEAAHGARRCGRRSASSSAGSIGAEAAFATFVMTMDSPVMQRSETQLEQDLWMTWMSKRPENANQILGDGDLAEYLQNTGVLKRIAGAGQSLNGRGARAGASASSQRLRHRRPRRRGRGAAAAARAHPRLGPRRDQAAPRRLRRGRAARSRAGGRRGASPDHVGAGRIPAAGRGGHGERDHERGGRRRAPRPRGRRHRPGAREPRCSSPGIEPATYVPEAADKILPVLDGGIAYDPELKGRVKTAATYDGVLVSELDGTKLALICPMTDRWLAGRAVCAVRGRARRGRSSSSSTRAGSPRTTSATTR